MSWKAFEIPLPKDAFRCEIEIDRFGKPQRYSEPVARLAGQIIEKRRFVSDPDFEDDNKLVWYIYDKDDNLILQGITYGGF